MKKNYIHNNHSELNKLNKYFNFLSNRLEIKIKELLAMIIQDFKDNYQDYQEEINGKQLQELF
jgi:hypothetical protein